MNTLLTRSTDLTHPPQQLPTPQRLARLGLADRLALRIGLWLILRAERPKPARRIGPDIDALRREHELSALRALAFEPRIR